MIVVVKIDLENEMDLILAHKRSMKLAELCGLSVLMQTSFATAVSEIARCVINAEEKISHLELGITTTRGNRRELTAILTSPVEFGKEHTDSLRYARRLANSVELSREKKTTRVLIVEKINFSGLLNDARVESFINYFKKELPLSPYDEIRKKNIQLLELSEKLKESEDQYRRLSETLPLMVFTTNTAGYITYANQWLKDYFSLLEIPANKLLWTSLLDVSEHKHIFPLWEKSQLMRSEFRSQAKVKATTKKEAMWHLVSMIPFENDEKQLAGFTGFFVDIHAQKLVEETLKNNVELKAAQKQLLNYQSKLEANLKELNKSNHDLEQFAYIASHDLQEPLRKIINFSELLDKNFDDKVKARKFLSKIEHSSARMSVLIRDVLNYSRLSKAEAHFEDCELQKIAADVLVDMELMIEEKKANVTCGPLPVVSGILQQLHQLFYNIIGNALKFCTDNPVISVTCRNLPLAEVQQNEELHQSVNYIELSFRDNGIGFDQKYARQIFTIFKRLNAKETFEGTGIGLALCKKIVDNHHGLISAESAVGKGTTFRIILPIN